MSESRPVWARWRGGAPWTVGVEEEVMLLDPASWALAPRIDDVLASLDPGLAAHVSPETHRSALELATGVHDGAGEAADELRGLRGALGSALDGLGLAAGAAGTHPTTLWTDTVVSSGARYRSIHASMRELARREPTFALHVHVAVPGAEAAARALTRMRAHLPVLLALSGNSPFWQGRDTGLASARTPLFGAFPRVGIPRAFTDYGDYVESVDVLLRCGAIADPTLLWWDVRLQPRLGTLEVRIMDAQERVADVAALVALVQCLVRMEALEGHVPERLVQAPEVLEENRFLAARDGVAAELVDPVAGTRRPLEELVDELLSVCAPHAVALGCRAELAGVPALLEDTGAGRQRARAAAAGGDLTAVTQGLAGAFATGEPAYSAR